MSRRAVMAQPSPAAGVTASLLLLLMMGACAGDDHPQPSVSTPPAGSREPSLVQLPPDLSTETIAFVRTDTDGNDHIYVARADGSELRQLESQPGCKQKPAWSPDGRVIAYRYLPDCDYTSNKVYVINADGSGVTDLSAVSGIDGASPSWSADGQQIVFWGQESPEALGGIYIMNADGTNPVRLTSTEVESQYPAVSPDGSQIAFSIVNHETSDFDLWLMDINGDNQMPLVEGPGHANWPMWSPDGSQIAYAREPNISIVLADGSDVGLLDAARAMNGGVPASWAPGASIAFSCLPEGDVIVLCAALPEGSDPIVLLNGMEANFPAWKP